MSDTPLLTRETMLSAKDLKLKKIRVDEWGGDIYLRTITARERDLFEASLLNGNKLNARNIRARLLVLCVCDDKGKRIFTNADADALGEHSAAVIDPIFNECRKLNRFSQADIKSLEKN